MAERNRKSRKKTESITEFPVIKKSMTNKLFTRLDLKNFDKKKTTTTQQHVGQSRTHQEGIILKLNIGLYCFAPHRQLNQHRRHHALKTNL